MNTLSTFPVAVFLITKTRFCFELYGNITMRLSYIICAKKKRELLIIILIFNLKSIFLTCIADKMNTVKNILETVVKKRTILNEFALSFNYIECPTINYD